VTPAVNVIPEMP
jgi:hypothetical protein